MGLDKLKKKKKKPNQLVSKRKDGKRPGYYGSDAGFGDYDDSPSSGGSSGGAAEALAARAICRAFAIGFAPEVCERWFL